MDSLDSSESSEKDSWIDRFLSLDGNEFLCEVDTDYIQDSFNLYGLRDIVTDFKHALKTILDHYDTTASDSDDPDFNNARILYGLIHQRFILTKRGLDKMFRKYRQGDFGVCPVTSCNDARMLPVGFSTAPNESNVKLYCPSCRNAFHPNRCLDRHNKHACSMDGAYFGTTFAHLLVLTFPQPFDNLERDQYIPRIFGFKIHHPEDEEMALKDGDGTSGSSSSSSMRGGSVSGSSSNKARGGADGTTEKGGDGGTQSNVTSGGKSTSKEKKEKKESKRLRSENAKLREKVALLSQQLERHKSSRGGRRKDSEETRQEEAGGGGSTMMESKAKRKQRTPRGATTTSNGPSNSTSSTKSSSKSKRQKHHN